MRSAEDRLKEFKERMDADLEEKLVPGVDLLATAIPEDTIEYIGDITEFI